MSDDSNDTDSTEGDIFETAPIDQDDMHTTFKGGKENPKKGEVYQAMDTKESDSDE